MVLTGSHTGWALSDTRHEFAGGRPSQWMMPRPTGSPACRVAQGTRVPESFQENRTSPAVNLRQGEMEFEMSMDWQRSPPSGGTATQQ